MEIFEKHPKFVQTKWEADLVPKPFPPWKSQLEAQKYSMVGQRRLMASSMATQKAQTMIGFLFITYLYQLLMNKIFSLWCPFKANCIGKLHMLHKVLTFNAQWRWEVFCVQQAWRTNFWWFSLETTEKVSVSSSGSVVLTFNAQWRWEVFCSQQAWRTNFWWFSKISNIFFYMRVDLENSKINPPPLASLAPGGWNY